MTVELSCCPKCGHDLDSFQTLSLGDLTVDYAGAVISWRGRALNLSAAERLLVIALAKAAGAPVRRDVLAEAFGHDGDNPLNTVAVLIHRIRAKFRALDPAFDQISSIRGFGVRWRTEA